MVSIVGASGRTPIFSGERPLATTMQSAQKLKSEARLSRVSRDNDEVEAQSRSERNRWTFYETTKCVFKKYHGNPDFAMERWAF